MKEKLIKNENSKKWFVVSDIHSFLKPLLNGLKVAGYRKTDPNHTLVIIGDLFDRGEETVGLYKYLMSIPQERLILIRGNHERLYKTLLRKHFPQQHDVSNGTLNTFMSQCPHINQEYLYKDYWDIKDYDENKAFTGKYDDEPRKCWKQVIEEVSKSEITKLILDDSRWVNYYEIGPYVLTHSFIPVKDITPEDKKYEYDYTYNPYKAIWENWRTEATEEDFDNASWGCPWWQFQMGWFNKEIENGKILVCGHWHTSDFFTHLDFYKGKPKNTIYYSKNLIAIDGGVRYKYKVGSYQRELVHKQNVLIIDENFDCFDRNRKKLNS